MSSAGGSDARSLEVDPEDTEARAPDDQVELAMRREAVRAPRWPRPTGQERDLIALKFAGGLSNGEIARVLRHVRVERGHPPAPHHHEAERGLP